MTRREPILREALLLLALVLAFFAPALFSHYTEVAWDERVLSPWAAEEGAHDVGFGRAGAGGLTADGLFSYYPRRVVVHEALREGRLPLWSGASFAGMPFLANFQAGALYPINALLAPLSPARGMGAFAAAHVLLLGLGCLVLLRALGVGRAGAAAGAVAASWNGFVVMRLAHPTAVATLAWLPWLLWLSRRLLLAPGARGAAFLAAAWALAVLAGFPPVLVHMGYALALFSLALALPGGGEARATPRGLAFLALALLAGCGLAAPQLLSTIELARFSDRAEIPYASVLSSAIHPALAARLFAPAFFGDPIDGTDLSRAFSRGDGHYGQSFLSSGVYLGIPVLLFAFAGALDRRREARALGLLALLGLLLAFGAPLLRVAAAALPGFRIARIDRAIGLAAVAAGLLAGIGVDRAERDPRVCRALLAALGALLALFAALLLVGLVLRGDLVAPFIADALQRSDPDASARALLRPAIATAATLVALWFVAHGAPGRAALLLPILIVDLGSFAVRHHFPRDTRDFLAETPGIAFLRERALASRAAGGGGDRIVRFGGSEAQVLPPNLPGLFGLEDVQGYNALAMRGTMEYFGAIEPEARRDRRLLPLRRVASLESPLFRLLAAPVVVSQRPFSGRIPAYVGADLIVTEFEAYPRAFLVHHAARIDSLAEALAAIGGGAVDPLRTAIVMNADVASLVLDPDPAGQEVGESVVWRAQRDEEIALQVHALRPALLFLSEVWYPGWEADVDGARAPILRANGIFRAVPVPAGEHVVRLRYRPASLRRGFLIAAASAIVLAFAFLPRAAAARRSP